jgi:hypothetical protein
MKMNHHNLRIMSQLIREDRFLLMRDKINNKMVIWLVIIIVIVIMLIIMIIMLMVIILMLMIIMLMLMKK